MTIHPDDWDSIHPRVTEGELRFVNTNWSSAESMNFIGECFGDEP